MWSCSREEVWEASLPLGVRVFVNGDLGGGLAASFRVETVCGAPLGDPLPARPA